MNGASVTFFAGNVFKGGAVLATGCFLKQIYTIFLAWL